jgi:hypothetical protein
MVVAVVTMVADITAITADIEALAWAAFCLVSALPR